MTRPHHSTGLKLWRATLAAAFLAALFFALTLQANALEMLSCDDWHAVRNRLDERFGEQPVSRGQIGPNAVLVVLASRDGLTFTVVRVSAKGTACAIAAGAGWEPGENLLGEEF